MKLRMTILFLALATSTVVANAQDINVFDYGIASRGAISMTGNAKVSGKNNPAEANVLSATYSNPNAVSMNGNCSIGGDMSISNPNGTYTMVGNDSVAGFSQSNSQIDNHIHIGVGDVDFPQADPSSPLKKSS